LLIRAKQGVDEAGLFKKAQEIECMQQVDFVDVVRGTHDLVAIAESKDTVDALCLAVSSLDWVDDVDVLRVLCEQYSG